MSSTFTKCLSIKMNVTVNLFTFFCYCLLLFWKFLSTSCYSGRAYMYVSLCHLAASSGLLWACPQFSLKSTFFSIFHQSKCEWLVTRHLELLLNCCLLVNRTGLDTVWSSVFVLVIWHWPIGDVREVWDQDSAFKNEAAQARLWWWIKCKCKYKLWKWPWHVGF